MKHFRSLMLGLLMVASIVCVHAQNSGLGFNYQALVRKSNGLLLANADVSLRISLYPGQAATTPTWVETHNVHTDASGCFGITVGKGTRQSNSVVTAFKDVNFAAVYYWMKIELQESGTYREISYSQLPSTPYSEVSYNAMMPAGMIVPFAGPKENIPDGWLLCDGATVSRTTFFALFRAIGTAWGQGDGTTTFNLPDLRGMFLRGVSGDSGNDVDAESRMMLKNENGGNTGNNVGSYQGDAIRNITGSINASSSADNCQAFGETYPEADGALKAILGWQRHLSDGSNGNTMLRGVVFDASGSAPVGSDNRPKNVYVNYMIKY